MKRKRSAWHYVRQISHEVRAHPANADHPWRALARAVGWQVRKRVARGPVDVPFEGFVLTGYPDSGSVSNVFYFTSRYDWDEMAFLDRYLRPGGGFLDIGANIGTYSLFAAARIGRDARIEAFEALPVAAGRARENFERNGLTGATVHQVAVDDHAGEAGFLDFDVSSALDHDTDRRGRTPITVAVDRLDALVKGGGFAFAKLDVEGVELRALRGARRLVEAHDPPVWLVEVYDFLLRKHGGTEQELLAWMADAGYRATRYDAEAGQLVPFVPGEWLTHPNCLFVAEDRYQEVVDRLEGRA
jgi:FkbM family methyltransferase